MTRWARLELLLDSAVLSSYDVVALQASRGLQLQSLWIIPTAAVGTLRYRRAAGLTSCRHPIGTTTARGQPSLETLLKRLLLSYDVVAL